MAKNKKELPVEIEEEETPVPNHNSNPEPQLQPEPEAQALEDLQAVTTIENPNHEYVKFIKEWSRFPDVTYTDIARDLNIAQATANIYEKRFERTLHLLRHDRQQIQKVVAALNKLNPEAYITDNDIRALAKGYNQNDIIESAKKMESVPSSPNPNSTPQQEEQHERFTRFKTDYSTLRNSSRSYILRYVLEHSPWVHNTEVDSLIAMFELQEDILMRSPNDMLEFCKKSIGEKTGPNVFQAFSNIIQTMLPPEQQFGNVSWVTQQYSTTATTTNPQSPYSGAFYYEKGILPPYLSIDSPEAKSMIWEYQQEQRRNLEEEKRQKDWDERMKRYMNMKMMDIVDPNKANGNGHSQGGIDMSQMVLAGLVRAVPSSDEKGNFIWKYEKASADPNAQNNANNPSTMIDTTMKMASTMMEMFKTLRPPEQNGADTVTSTLVKGMVEKLPSLLDPLEGAVRYKKYLETMSPQQNPAAGIETGKLELAKTKMQQDFEFAKNTQLREDRRLELEIARQDKQEERSSSMMQNLFGSIGRIGEKAFVPLLMMFMGNKMGGGGGMGMLGPIMSMLGEGAGGGGAGGGIGDILGSLMGGGGGGAGAGGLGGLSSLLGGMGGMGGAMGGAPPGPAPRNFSFPESEPPSPMSEYERQRQAKFAVPPSDMYGYHNYPQPTPPAGQPAQQVINQSQQPMQQPMQQQSDIPNYSKPTIRQFAPTDFQGYNLDQLMMMKNDGTQSKSSIDSFNSALEEAIAAKMMDHGMKTQTAAPVGQPGFEQYAPPEQREQQQQGKVIQTTQTTETIVEQPTDAAIQQAEAAGDIV